MNGLTCNGYEGVHSFPARDRLCNQDFGLPLIGNFSGDIQDYRANLSYLCEGFFIATANERVCHFDERSEEKFVYRKIADYHKFCVLIGSSLRSE